MDRYVNQDSAGFQKGEVRVDVEFTSIASGAPPAALSSYLRAAGIVSVVLSDTTLYTVNLQDAYVGLIEGTMQVQQATYSASAGCKGELVTNSVTSSTAPLVAFRAVQNGTGAAAAVVEGDIVRINLRLKRLSED